MSIDFAALRLKMVDGQVRTTDVTQIEIIDAMLEVPRELFVSDKRQALAYIDEDVEIAPATSGRGARYLMEPSPFAKLVQLADVRANDFVLMIGAGTGYGAAVLSRIASSVIALEEDEALAQQATSLLSQHGFDNVVVATGPLTAGYPAQGPYDVIIVEGAVDQISDAILDQLEDDGRLVAVFGTGLTGSARLYVRDGETVGGRDAFNAAVKRLPGFEKAREFQF